MSREYTVGFNIEVGGFVTVKASSKKEAEQLVEEQLEQDEQEVSRTCKVVHRDTMITHVLRGSE